VRSIRSPETNGPRRCANTDEALTQGTEDPLPQADTRLSASHPSIQQVAGAINAMIAERAAERLGNAPAAAVPSEPPGCIPQAPGVYFGLPTAEYRALHKLVLEGEEAFARAFAEEPQPSGYPGCLVTLEDLKAKCRELGEPVSGTKAELAKRIKAKDPKTIVFDDILGLFQAMAERDGLEVLKPDAMREVPQSAATITVNPHLARAFTGGVP
jgi:SAP domain